MSHWTYPVSLYHSCVLCCKLTKSASLLSTNFSFLVFPAANDFIFFGNSTRYNPDTFFYTIDPIPSRLSLTNLHYTGKATKESDVYSFGTLMLEVLCGRTPVNLQVEDPDDDFMRVQNVWRAQEGGNILSAVDRGLRFSRSSTAAFNQITRLKNPTCERVSINEVGPNRRPVLSTCATVNFGEERRVVPATFGLTVLLVGSRVSAINESGEAGNHAGAEQHSGGSNFGIDMYASFAVDHGLAWGSSLRRRLLRRWKPRCYEVMEGSGVGL